MTHEWITGILMILGAALIASLSQILLKRSAGKPHRGRMQEYLNPYVIGGYALLLGTTFINVCALQRVPLSLASALDASGQIFVPFFSWLILKEQINRKKLLGMFVIIIGILLFFI